MYEVDYVASLEQMRGMFKQLDRRYGPPTIKIPEKRKGEYAMRSILKYLSNNKQSTCEEMAKKEYENNPQSLIKEKSIADNFRKFIKHNLIWPQLVIEDGTKKVYNKKVQAYSLTPIGIMYSIYLFSNLELDEGGASYSFGGATKADLDDIFEKTGDSSVYNTQLEIDLTFVRNLAKEYSQTLPKIFGRLDLFEKIIGDKFELVFIFILSHLFFPEEPGLPQESRMLYEQALYSFWPHKIERDSPRPLLLEQISMIFYIYLESGIEEILSSRDFEERSQLNLEKKKGKKQKTWQESKKLAKQKWLEIMDEDKKIKKWYFDFVKEALESKTRELNALKYYRQIVFTKQI